MTPVERAREWYLRQGERTRRALSVCEVGGQCPICARWAVRIESASVALDMAVAAAFTERAP